MRKAFRLAIDDQVDVALPPASHRLAAMTIGRREAQGLQHVTELRCLFLVCTELDELDPLTAHPVVRRRCAGDALLNLLQQVRE